MKLVIVSGRRRHERPDRWLYRWRSGGGGHWAAVVAEEDVSPRAAEVEPLESVHDLIIFLAAPFMVWETEEAIFVALNPHRMGLAIGKGGWKVKALTRHFGKRVQFIPAHKVTPKFDGQGFAFTPEEVEAVKAAAPAVQVEEEGPWFARRVVAIWVPEGTEIPLPKERYSYAH